MKKFYIDGFDPESLNTEVSEVHDHSVYALTPKGDKELKKGGTSLAPKELEFLIRSDGYLTLAQIREGMSNMADEDFWLTLTQLLDMGLLRLAQIDPFAAQVHFQLDGSDLEKAEVEADQGSHSLHQTGFYVSIVKKRDASTRKLGPNEKMTVLVVEDDADLARLIKGYLEFDGFNVRLAGKRDEVLMEIRTPPLPNLVLLDVMLPDADGFDILLRMRQHPVLKLVPVIMLTGKATRESVIRGLASGADGYITKPFQADALMSAIRTTLGLPPAG
jgi:two-component system, OmpR family, response regulator